MGAGKTRLGREAAARLRRPFVDLDADIVEQAGMSIPELFEREGESGFRAREEQAAARALASTPPAVIALGGGALGSSATRALLASHLVVRVDVDLDMAWERARRSQRPLARDEASFRALYAERAPVYRQAADAEASDTAGII